MWFSLSQASRRRSGMSNFVSVAVLILLIAGSGAPLAAQVAPPGTAVPHLPTPLTLQDALSIALRQQPQLYNSLDQKNVASGQETQAKAQYFPTVDPQFQYRSERTVDNGFSTGFIGGGGSPFYTNGGTTSIVLNQLLFNNGLRELNNAQARRSVDIANFNNRDVVQSIVLTVTQDYYNLLRQIDQVKVAQSSVAEFQQTVDLTQAQVTAGSAAASDIYQARSNLANAQVTLIEDQNLVRTASANLKNAMGVVTSDEVQPQPLATGDQLPPLPDAGPVKTLDDYVTIAYATRPDIKEQQATVESQNEAVKIAQINAGLQITGTYGLTYTPTNDLGTKGTDSVFIATASYPLFDGGSSRAAVKIAAAQRDAAKNQLELTRQSVHLDVETAYIQRSEALQRATLAQTAVQAGQVSYDAAVASRKEGVSTLLDVLTAQDSLITAQNQYISAIYDFYTADASLRRAIGQNDQIASGTKGP